MIRSVLSLAWCSSDEQFSVYAREDRSTAAVAAAAASATPLASHVQLSVGAGDARLKPYVAPIVEACNRLQNVMLKSVDPELWKALQTAGIEPQIYGMCVFSF